MNLRQPDIEATGLVKKIPDGVQDALRLCTFAGACTDAHGHVILFQATLAAQRLQALRI